MKNLLFVLFIVFLGVITAKNEKPLYLLYSKNDEKIKKFYFGSDEYLTFTYTIIFEGKEYKTVAFDEVNPKRVDTVDITEIKAMEFKNIEWLKKKYLEYFNYFKGDNPRIDEDGTLREFDLNKMYKSIYIVIPDSCAGKAVITQVKYNSSFSID